MKSLFSLATTFFICYMAWSFVAPTVKPYMHYVSSPAAIQQTVASTAQSTVNGVKGVVTAAIPH